MALFYSDTEPKQAPKHPVDYFKLHASKHFLTHYSNYLTLAWMVHNTRDAREKIGLVKEMSICERKLTYWQRHPNYNMDEVTLGVLQLKRRWRAGNGSDPLAGIRLGIDINTRADTDVRGDTKTQAA